MTEDDLDIEVQEPYHLLRVGRSCDQGWWSCDQGGGYVIRGAGHVIRVGRSCDQGCWSCDQVVVM